MSSATPTVGTPTSCKNPGGSCATRPKGYSFFVQVCNPGPTNPIYIYGANVFSAQDTSLSFAFLVPPLPVQIAPGACVTVEYVASSTNSADIAITVTVEMMWGHTPQPPDPDNHPPVIFSFTVSGTPPACECPAV